MTSRSTPMDMLDHRPGDGHPERPERLRAVTDALRRRQRPRPRGAATRRSWRKPISPGCTPAATCDAIFGAAPGRGPAAARSRHRHVGRQPERGAPRRRRRGAGRARRGRGRDRAGVLRRASAGPPRRAGATHGLLHLLQRGGGRPRGPGARAWPGWRWWISTSTTATAPRRPSTARTGLFFASIQQWPHVARHRPSVGEPAPQHRQRAVPPGAPREVWRKAFETLMPAVDAFAPDLILISAGFDAHARDPLGDGGQSLEAEDFAWATRAIASVAQPPRQGPGCVVARGRLRP